MRHPESISSTLSGQALCPPDDENPLTERGRRQLDRLIHQSTPFPTRPTIISSPARRCTEAARLLAEGNQSGPAIIWEELREIFDVNEPTRLDLLHQRIVAFWNQYYRANSGERSRMPQHLQAVTVLQRICEDYSENDNILIVSHGGKIELLTAIILGIASPLDRTIQFELQLGGCHLFDMVLNGHTFSHTKVCWLNR
jgi:broad specificity phosphatase PhoE